MKQLAPAALILCLATPLHAESDEMAEGMDLLSRGAQLLFQSLITEIEPAMKEMEEALGNLNAYHTPEVLPNGDIIIRRKVPLVPDEAPEAEIDL